MITRYPPAGNVDAGRGLAAYSKRLAVALTRCGWRVTVLADRLGEGPERYEEDGVDVWRRWRIGMHAVPDIRETLPTLRPDVFHLQHELFVFGRGVNAAAPPILLRMLGASRTVTTIHGVLQRSDFGGSLRAYVPGVPWPIVRWGYAGIMRRMVRHSHTIVTHSAPIAAALRQYWTPRRQEVIPLPLPEPHPPKMSRPDALKKLGLDDRMRAVFFGYVLPYKGVETLVAAAPRLAVHGIDVLIAGSAGGDERATHRLKDFSPQDGIRRLGFVPEELLPALFAVADVMVFPYSVGLSSSGPLALAIAYDVPAVVSNVPTLASELGVEEATFPVGDAESLAATIRRVLLDESIRSRLEARYRAIRLERAISRVARRTVACYKAVGSSNGTRSG